jgi:hypothetical protein
MMSMSVNFTVFFAGMALVALAVVLFSRRLLEWFYRWLIFSKSAPVLLFGTGGIWFLNNVLHLSVADFGRYKIGFFIVFGIVLALSFFKMSELLAVRGVAVLLLLYAKQMLDSVYCEPILAKNFFVSFTYALIIIGMIIGSVPYLCRNCLFALLNSTAARISLGALSTGCGIFLMGAANRGVG